MEYLKDFQEWNVSKDTIVTLGKFDGVHRGHKKLLFRVLALGKERDFSTVVFTFQTQPNAFLSQKACTRLMTNDERAACFRNMGFDVLFECPFTEEIRSMPPETFVKDVLLDRMHARAVIAGDDFHFGKNRAGNPAFLKEMGKKYGFYVEIIDKEMDGDYEISSTLIKDQIMAGKMEAAEHLLGFPYSITGPIVHGAHLGTGIGIPTINQIPSCEKMLPPFGVYFSKTLVGGKEYQSITNIGKKPTVDGSYVGVETHLFNCSLDLYGKEAEVLLLHYHRQEKKFENVDALLAQLKEDIASAKEYYQSDS